MEAFYQESGRAGRDGQPSISLVYYSKEEASRFQFLASQHKTGAERALAALETMVHYCMNPGCRRKYLLGFFGETNTDPKTVCRGKCDYCQNSDKVMQAIEAASAAKDFAFYTNRKSNSNNKESEWDGQWKAPHGDDNNDENNDNDWWDDGPRKLESSGLLVRSTGRSESSNMEIITHSDHHPNKTKSKKSVDSVLEKYEV